MKRALQRLASGKKSRGRHRNSRRQIGDNLEIVSGPIDVLREENKTLKGALATRDNENSALRAAMEKMREEHEEKLLRLTAELLCLKQRMFGPKQSG